MLHRTKRVTARAVTTAFLAGALVGTTAGASQALESGSSSGTGLIAEFGNVDVTAGEAAYPEGPKEDEAATISIGRVGKARILYANASGDKGAGTTKAEAGLAEVDMRTDDLDLKAKILTARCQAKPGRKITGEAVLTEAVLSVPGTEELKFRVEPAPNTTYVLPGGLGKLVVNEQIRKRDSLTVNAFHLTLDGKELNGELIIGSVTCKPGKPDKATMVGQVKDKKNGKGVPDVVLEVVDQGGKSQGTCATDARGECGVDFLPKSTYYLCVADVPAGYRMPHYREVCRGPHEVDHGDLVVVKQPFLLDHDGGKGKGKGGGDDDRSDRSDRGNRWDHQGHGYDRYDGAMTERGGSDRLNA